MTGSRSSAGSGSRAEPGARASGHERFEMTMLHRSAREFPVEVTSWTIETGESPVFSCFIRDISERQAVERAKNEFVSVVGHELRTPLTSIHGVLGLLRAGLLGDLSDRGQQMVDIAVHNTDRLVRLINDILDIERLNSGRVSLQQQQCDSAALAMRSIEAMRPMAESAGVRLEVDARAGERVGRPGPGRADAHERAQQRHQVLVRTEEPCGSTRAHDGRTSSASRCATRAAASRPSTSS